MDIWAIIGLSLIVLMFLSGSPLAVAFGVGAALIALICMGVPFNNLGDLAFSSINSFPLLACPFFILAGQLLLHCGGMPYVRDFMQSWLGHIRGGLAVGALVMAAFLGSVSGSAAACLAILGTIALPIMVDSGYSRPFCAGLVTTGSELGLLIPPSLFLILFGAINHVSIPALFLGGIGPGLLMALFMAVPAVMLSRRRKYPTSPKISWRARGGSFVKGFPIFMMPVVILGGIYSGIFSPTESAAIACFYAIIVGFIYRQISWARISEALLVSVKLASMIYLLVVGADLMSKMFAYLMIPQHIVQAVTSIELGPTGFLLLAEVVLLAMGFFFSSIPMVIVVLPLFMPVVNYLGINPIFYGILAIMCSIIGEVTPPNGPALWIAEPICKVKMFEIMNETWLFLAAMVLAVVVSTFVPGVVMLLVRLW